MNPKRFLLCLLLLFPVSAWAGSTVTVDTRAANLLPGTKVRVEIGAEYRMHELPKRPANSTERILRVPITDDMLRYRAASTNRGLWQFAVTPNTVVPTPKMELRWDKDFPSVPQGMSSKVWFNLKYTIELPPQDGEPAYTMNRVIETTLRLPEGGDAMTGCLRLEGVGKGVFVGVTPSCETPLNRGRMGGGR
jgi:hypothetical protein